VHVCLSSDLSLLHAHTPTHVVSATTNPAFSVLLFFFAFRFVRRCGCAPPETPVSAVAVCWCLKHPLHTTTRLLPASLTNSGSTFRGGRDRKNRSRGQGGVLRRVLRRTSYNPSPSITRCSSSPNVTSGQSGGSTVAGVTCLNSAITPPSSLFASCTMPYSNFSSMFAPW
jgi:hypothetical protein